jgi:hypothetical protein
MKTVIVKEVMDPETETDMHRVQEEDIIPTVKPRIQRTTATDVDAMIANVIDLGNMMIERGIGSGVEGIAMRDQGVGHPKLSGRGMGWQDQIDLGRENVNEREGIDGLHHLVGASLQSYRVVYAQLSVVTARHVMYRLYCLRSWLISPAETRVIEIYHPITLTSVVYFSLCISSPFILSPHYTTHHTTMSWFRYVHCVDIICNADHNSVKDSSVKNFHPVTSSLTGFGELTEKDTTVSSSYSSFH